MYWSMVTYFLYTIFMLGSTIYHYKKVKFQDICVVYGMTLLVTTALNTVSLMRYLNPQHCMLYVVMALFAAWIADAGAYFVGSFIGKHKLCPNISPKKTVIPGHGGMMDRFDSVVIVGPFIYLFIQLLPVIL